MFNNVKFVICVSFLAILNCFCAEKDIRQHRNWPWKIMDDCGINHADDRIIGGINASLGQYPWLARLGYKTNNSISYDCGGALITEQYVLTAAHCVTHLGSRVLTTIVLGENNAETEIDCENDYCADPIQVLFPKRIIFQSNYDKTPYKHDIALIQLNRAIKITEWITPICLPFGNALKLNSSKNGVEVIGEVAGWGLTESDATRGTPYLQTVKLPILEIQYCAALYGSAIKIGKEQLCVGGLVGKDSCAGDSGGPLVKVMNSEIGPRYFALGIVSFGSKRCGEMPMPGIYTNVIYYMQWILDHLDS